MEIFNFKNTECKKQFYEVTENTIKLSECFGNPEDPFLKQSNKFLKV